MKVPFVILLTVFFLDSFFHVSAKERPNVLMIAVDDLNDWVGALGGHPDVITPHLDALAARGRNFTNAHCSVTVCSPSRVSVISGVSPFTHGSYELGAAYQNIPRLDEVPTMQAYFQQHGYKTFVGGKILHHGFVDRLTSDVDHFLTEKKGGPRPRPSDGFKKGTSWSWGAFPETNEQMYDYQLAEEAAAVLGKKHEEPFFLSVGIFRPHVPLFAPPEWFDLYDPDRITLPNIDPSDMDDIPENFQYKMWVAPTLKEFLDAGDWESLVHAFLANTSFADHCVGRILEGLDKGPNKDNTIVVLWSDHGFHLGEKQHIAKRTLWEESTRVPLMIAGPGIEPGDCVEPVSLLDIYPTLVNLAELPVNDHLEGHNLVPQLNDPATAREEPAISSSYFGNHSVRSRDWRFIRYADGAEELYDHRKDPDERTNLAGDSRFEKIKAEHAAFIPKEAAAEVKPLSEQEQVKRGRRSL